MKYNFDFETLEQKNIFIGAIENTEGKYAIWSNSKYPLHIEVTCSPDKMNAVVNYVCLLAHHEVWGVNE